MIVDSMHAAAAKQRVGGTSMIAIAKVAQRVALRLSPLDPGNLAWNRVLACSLFFSPNMKKATFSIQPKISACKVMQVYIIIYIYNNNYIYIHMPVSHIQSHQITILIILGVSWGHGVSGILYFQSPRYASPSHRSSRSSEDCSAFWAAFCDLARRLGECQLGLKQGVPQQSSIYIIYCNRVAIRMGNT